jgi:protein tyrosine phosphatase
MSNLIRAGRQNRHELALDKYLEMVYSKVRMNDRIVILTYHPNKNRRWFEFWKPAYFEKKWYLKVKNGFVVREEIRKTEWQK